MTDKNLSDDFVIYSEKPSSSDNVNKLSETNTDVISKKKIKAVALLSGGLDSNIAVRMMKEQNIDV
ncbi:MAG TPA: hypothetical protein VN704_02630, partial [Verrucomicrobiae bacterium]|nr:hypothetical protein [Verrucomicrobiae bacterium]